MGNALTKLVAGVTPSSPPPSVHWKGYKPDSVIDSHLSMRPVPAALTPNRFGALTRAASRRLFGLAPDEVFRAADIAIGAVGSYPAFSPLPAPEADEAGGLFSVALSVNPTLHRAALACERHRALWSLDFPPPRELPGQRLSALPKLIEIKQQAPAARISGPVAHHSGCQYKMRPQ